MLAPPAKHSFCYILIGHEVLRTPSYERPPVICTVSADEVDRRKEAFTDERRGQFWEDTGRAVDDR